MNARAELQVALRDAAQAKAAHVEGIQRREKLDEELAALPEALKVKRRERAKALGAVARGEANEAALGELDRAIADLEARHREIADLLAATAALPLHERADGRLAAARAAVVKARIAAAREIARELLRPALRHRDQALAAMALLNAVSEGATLSVGEVFAELLAEDGPIGLGAGPPLEELRAWWPDIFEPAP